MNKVKVILGLLVFAVLAACSSTNMSKENADASKSAAGQKKVDLSSVSVVYFDFDKSAIKASESAKLDDQAVWLANNPKANITIEGHTDYLGTREYNLALGERRANSSKTYLVKKGVDSKRIKTVSYGKDKQVDSAETDEARAKNRRTVSIEAK
jgi:peptidoglycan-associated lipoprotein